MKYLGKKRFCTFEERDYFISSQSVIDTDLIFSDDHLYHALVHTDLGTWDVSAKGADRPYRKPWAGEEFNRANKWYCLPS